VFHLWRQSQGKVLEGQKIRVHPAPASSSTVCHQQYRDSSHHKIRDKHMLPHMSSLAFVRHHEVIKTDKSNIVFSMIT
jgi:hypothetical protein